MKNILLVILILFVVHYVRRAMALKHEVRAPSRTPTSKVIDLEQDPRTKVYRSKHKKS